MKWVDLERIDFRGNGALIVVSRADEINYREILGGIEVWQHSGNALELLPLIRGLIKKHRPELEGCYVWAMWFKVETRDWIIGIEHESLEPTVPGCMLPELSLVPQEALA